MGIPERAKEFTAPGCGIDFFNFSTITNNSRSCSAAYSVFSAFGLPIFTSINIFYLITQKPRADMIQYLIRTMCLYSCHHKYLIWEYLVSIDPLNCNWGQLQRFQRLPTIVCASFDCCGWPFLCHCQWHPLLTALKTPINHVCARLLGLNQRMSFIYLCYLLVFIAHFFYLVHYLN